MTSLPKATSAAEYLKSYVHDVLGAFQTGAGVHDGAPLPMTFELAVKSIWYEIDRVFYQEWPPDADRRVTLRVQGKRSLLDLLKILTDYGVWTVRSSTREVGEGEETVVHVTGVLHPSRKVASVALLVALLEVLETSHWSVTNTTFGVVA